VEARGSEKERKCQHWWIIDSNDVGRCKYCGATKDFGKLLRRQQKELSQKQSEIAQNTRKMGKRKRKHEQITRETL